LVRVKEGQKFEICRLRGPLGAVGEIRKRKKEKKEKEEVLGENRCFLRGMM